MRLIFLGAPGAGKGTQAKNIAQKYSIPVISTGDILRAALKDGNSLGAKAKGYMDKGELVPDTFIINLIRDRLQNPDCEAGFLLDGFPRSYPQAEALTALLKDLNKPLNAVINIDVANGAIIDRLKNRRICGNCGKDYNMVTNPPPEDLKCTHCGGEIYQRSDDVEETILNRLDVYGKATRPLISYYESQGNLETVNGHESPEAVYEAIVNFLDRQTI